MQQLEPLLSINAACPWRLMCVYVCYCMQATVLASVVVLALLVLAALVANVWLEAGRLTGTGNSDTAAGRDRSMCTGPCLA
jgi:hypothetical protein